MEIDARRHGTLGRITLNRPRAINALTPGMVEAIDAVLRRWAADAEVNAVLIDGAGERGLCAGGDIRFLYDNARAGAFDANERFLADEYRLNAHIARFSKPYIAIMDGLVMGGGVGISAHGSVRVVTERTTLAMPETGIGFVTDVGSTYLLSAAPGEFGTHVALTGGTIGAADAMLCGLADHHVASGRLPALIEALSACRDGEEVGRCAAAHASPPAPGAFADADWIDACYRHDGVSAIVAALDARPEEAARAAARRIGGNSPTSLAVTLRALRNGRRSGELLSCLQQEYRVGTGLIRRPDFTEGVRAAIVDKDRNPAWRPATAAEIDPVEIDALFRSTAPLDFDAG